jgi:hypothetical protein
MTGDRDTRVRALWWSTIRTLTGDEAKAALLQALVDLGEHWRKEHPEDGLPEDLGIPPDEYLTKLVARVRRDPPSEVGT